MNSFNKKKSIATAFITVATLAVFFTACKQTGGGQEPAPSVEAVEGGAVLILSPDNFTIGLTAKTADGFAMKVEGCTETELASDVQTVLHATGTIVVLKGNITELYCGGNKLTALNVQGLTALQRLSCGENRLATLNVQGCTALQEFYCFDNQLSTLNVEGCTALKELNCSRNKLDATAFTKLLTDLPQRKADDDAKTSPTHQN